MPFILIQGTFHLVGHPQPRNPSGFEPDGDSVQFKPPNPALLDQLDQPIAVGWSAAKEPPLGGGLGAHGGPHSGLDSVAFALGHAAEQGHDQVVGVGAGVDAAADLRTHSSTP
jgi:hypothetical protein